MAQNLYNCIFKAFCRSVTCWSLLWYVLFHILRELKRQHWLFLFKYIDYIFLPCIFVNIRLRSINVFNDSTGVP